MVKVMVVLPEFWSVVTVALVICVLVMLPPRLKVTLLPLPVVACMVPVSGVGKGESVGAGVDVEDVLEEELLPELELEDDEEPELEVCVGLGLGDGIGVGIGPE